MNDHEIFTAALDLLPGEREAFVKKSCGNDADLNDHVLHLLNLHERGGDFLDKPAAEMLYTRIAQVNSTRIAQANSEIIGTSIGPYKIREQIGEGGFGIVYVAEQTEPIRRKVALKVIKPGMDSREILARFEAERQALAMMDHTNIARVIDAGATEKGRPYFVMELVNGLPITQFCNQQKLSITERLQLFADLCRAVQHAHQKGIIHRDIKPSNVLVTLHDGKPIAKIIDFGVVKALSGKLTEQSVYTAMGQMVGTPLYMSPEQAEMSGLDVDTRSDIYSLGVLLYELLTGITPFDKESLKNAGYAEVQRVICETEPVKPSARLSTLNNQERSTVSDERQVDLRKLEQALRGDLDWVVMKALEKDRERRYETPSAFAEDIERFLADKPVEASPPSQLYRVRKYVVRHRVGITTATLVLISMIIGTGFSVWYAFEAQAARGRAEKSESLANERLTLLQEEQQKLKAEKQKLAAEQKKSDRNFTLAKEAVAKLMGEVASRHLVAYPELADFRAMLLKTADEFYSELIEADPQDHSIWLARSSIRKLRDQSPEALQDLLHAADIEPQNPWVHQYLAEFYRNTMDAKYRDADKALKHALRAVELQPEKSHFHETLGWVYYHALGESEAAAKAFRKAAELARSPKRRAWILACAYEAEGRWRDAIEVYQPFVDQIDATDSDYHRMSLWYLYLGDNQNAIAYGGKAIESNRFSVAGYNFRARAYYYLGELEKARDDWEKGLQLRPGNTEEIPKLLNVYLRLNEWNKAAELLDFLVTHSHLSWQYLKYSPTELVRASQKESLITAHENFVNRVIQKLRSNGQLHELLQFYLHLEHYENALGVCDELISENAKATKKLHLLRAEVLIRSGTLDENSENDLSKAVEIDSDDHYDWYRQALLQIYRGDVSAYRATCEMMADRFFHSTNSKAIFFTVWTCSLGRDSLADYRPMLELAERNLEQSPQMQYRQAYGAMLARSGEYALAQKHLLRASEGTNFWQTSQSYHHSFLAMVEDRLRHQKIASHHFRKAGQIRDDELARGATWTRVITMEILRNDEELSLEFTSTE